MENQEGYTGATSQFDMGIALLFRIHEVLNIISEARIENNFILWRNCLMAVSGEIEDLYTKEQEDEYLKLLGELDPLIAKSVRRAIPAKFQATTELNEEEFNDLYMKMRELDKFVRRQLNTRNMLLRKALDPKNIVGRMS